MTFDGLRKQGLRITVEVHALGDDGHWAFDDHAMLPVINQAVEKAIAELLMGEYVTVTKVTRMVG